ncbi:MAG: type III pantothenate kinase [Opitutales bacterium]
MSLLCIDIGNTSIHYGLVKNASVNRTGDYPTAKLLEGPPLEFSRALASLTTQATGIAFCSVVPEATEPLLQSLQPADKPVFHLTYKTCCGLDLVYPSPWEIGEDRIANALAAQALYGTPAIVVDMGTAVTLDIISRQGYEGGIIAPGLSVMTTHLHEHTALLPELRTEDLFNAEGAIGKSTVEAMQLGVAIGFSGMIEALVRKVREELKGRDGEEPLIITTGGSTANLTREWEDKSRYSENLTLKGLAVACERAMNEND